MGDTDERATAPAREPRLPPRWFIRTAWVVHRAMVRFSRGRLGLWKPKPGAWGTIVLRTTGRRSGAERAVILGYLEDGPNLVTLAMNGWADPEPAWWLNLQAEPTARVDLKDGTLDVRAREAEGAERERLWSAYCEVDKNLEAYAARRSRRTAVVVLEPVR
ncbi:nitroreductase/quinone reductase family protein [Cellulomonas palmilytica]|uniref:nitroreductase/quinone reductase family protein n=1 Tax=Cellulomonas palmilytica TaxID=2608402 RepID=UPI001F3D5237|nr:nitroreductase/quinone reductase family protein [Cellulomonas palmilytica]UJP40642.1 nitroreductase family deazaflavin-dependent oxidoreductase [Cellulomonas palmilytica]